MTILNVSFNKVTVNFRNATYQVSENNGSVFVCVVKDRTVEGSFSVEVTSIPRNARGRKEFPSHVVI